MLLLCLKRCYFLQVRSTGGEWRTVEVPSSVKAIVVLNLQSYAGGRDLWGLKDTAKDAQKGWRTPIFNDGTIEVGVMLYTSCKIASAGSTHCEQQVVLPGSDTGKYVGFTWPIAHCLNLPLAACLGRTVFRHLPGLQARGADAFHSWQGESLSDSHSGSAAG